MPEQERRYARRVDTDLGVATVLSGSEEICCLVPNVSSGGMALMTTPGQDLDRFIRIRASLGAGWPEIDLDAIVLRRQRREGRVRWGVQFYQPPAHILGQIEEFVRETSEEGQGQEEGSMEAGADDDLENDDLTKIYKAAMRSIEH